MNRDVPPSMGDLTGEVTEDSISTKAVNFEDSSFLAKNEAKTGKKGKEKPSVNNEESGSSEDEIEDNGIEEDGTTDKSDVLDFDEDFDNSEAEEFEKQFETTSSDDDSDDEDKKEESEAELMDRVMSEIADQPFEVAMENLQVSKEDVIMAGKGVFSKKGYFEMRFELPFGEYVILRSKTVNDFIDYNAYVRRLLLEPISQKEYDTFTQMRNTAYAIAEIDGVDYRDVDIEEKFEIVSAMSEIKITAIINATARFWRVAHLLLHPKAIDFFLNSPEA
jgi:hypothetical protein